MFVTVVEAFETLIDFHNTQLNMLFDQGLGAGQVSWKPRHGCWATMVLRVQKNVGADYANLIRTARIFCTRVRGAENHG
jgi:hypothetical protein